MATQVDDVVVMTTDSCTTPLIASLSASLQNQMPLSRCIPCQPLRVAVLGRAPLERASSLPDNTRPVAAGRTRSSADQGNGLETSSSVFRPVVRPRASVDSTGSRGSGSSINISRKSYERLTGCEPATSTPQVIPIVRISDTDLPTGSGSGGLDNGALRMGCAANNNNCVPQIDVAITPPDEEDSMSANGVRSPALFTLQGRRNPGQPQSHRLKITGNPPKRLRPFYYRDDRQNMMFISNPSVHCGAPPLLTITRDMDDASLVSDYITPTPYARHKDSIFANLGDDISLYGTPKEELSPFRETDASRLSPSNFLKDQIISFFQPSDNKLAMKLFGNKNALMKEKLRQKAAGNWVIHPCSNFR